jgi:spore maturation protein CgeB
MKKLKEILKEYPLIYRINASVKARRLHRHLGKFTKYYEYKAKKKDLVYSEVEVLHKVLDKIKCLGIDTQSRSRGSLRIFWVGTDWNQDNSGFLQALRTFGEVNIFTDINGRYGLLGPSKDGAERFQTDYACVKANSECLRVQLGMAIESGKIDLLLGQMWASRVSAAVLKEAQQMGIITMNISMDDKLPQHWVADHYGRRGSVGLGSGLDLVLTSTPDSCIWYMVEGVPAIFWPMASDPNRFKPYSESKKEYDVSFIGNKYGLRSRIIRGLQQAGISVEVFGRGWPNGSADPDQSADIFGKSRIILGVGNVAYSEDTFTVKLRDFDAPMAGALYITHRNPDLLRLFDEGKEIECYLTIDECIAKIKYYLRNPHKRIAIAHAAAERARRDHTWELRISHVLNAVGLLDDGKVSSDKRG